MKKLLLYAQTDFGSGTLYRTSATAYVWPEQQTINYNSYKSLVPLHGVRLCGGGVKGLRWPVQRMLALEELTAARAPSDYALTRRSATLV